MYEAFYGLSHAPFRTAPDPEFLFWSENHTLAFTMLRYGVLTRAPITVITGEIGAGKTTLLRQLLREAPQELEIGLVSNMQAGRGMLLDWVLLAFGKAPQEEPYVVSFQRLETHLIQTYAAGRRAVLIIDEAQNLSVDALEELRMLSNINADKDDLLQIVLSGQPQLRELLARPELTQFAHRISADFHLEALNSDEAEQYIQHRLNVAGAKWRIFPRHTCELVQEATRGTPRLINILCDLAMVYGFAAESKVIDDALLREFLASARHRGIYQQFAALSEAPRLVRQTGLAI
jgi:type II secretory pathway predicted ATPase ExeA